jgi:hypothetical protein
MGIVIPANIQYGKIGLGAKLEINW